MCQMHNVRLKHTGDLGPAQQKRQASGPDHIHWQGDDIMYDSAHARVKRRRGGACNYPCIDCGEVAQDWSYNRKAKRELYGPSKAHGKAYILAYSADPDDYEPRCRKCHSAFDNA